MSRHVPRVRRWRVRYHLEPEGLHCTVFVRTINKRFACWEARDMVRGKAWFPFVTRESVSLAPTGED
jgi:hypothetical protein